MKGFVFVFVYVLHIYKVFLFYKIALFIIIVTKLKIRFCRRLNIGKGDESRQWTDPKDGGETLAENIARIGDTSTFRGMANYITAYESIYGVDLNRALREDDENRDTRTIYGIAGLRAYGITNANIINTYFDKREIDMGVIKQGVISDGIGYSLKNDIVIDGKVITIIEELVKALGIKNDKISKAEFFALYNNVPSVDKTSSWYKFILHYQINECDIPLF